MKALNMRVKPPETTKMVVTHPFEFKRNGQGEKGQEDELGNLEKMIRTIKGNRVGGLGDKGYRERDRQVRIRRSQQGNDWGREKEQLANHQFNFLGRVGGYNEKKRNETFKNRILNIAGEKGKQLCKLPD